MKPKVKLVGRDGNVFAILGACSQALKKAGQREKAKELTDRVMNGEAHSYHQAIAICLEYVDAH